MSDIPKDAEPAREPATTPAAAPTGDGYFTLLGITAIVAYASVQIFDASVKAETPWAGMAATGALSLMGIGIVFAIVRVRR